MQQNSSSLHLPSLAMLIMSGLGLLLYLSMALGLLFLALFALRTGASPDQQVLPMLSSFWAMAFLGLLLLPSLGIASTYMFSTHSSFHPSFPLDWKGSHWLILLLPLLIGLGLWVSQLERVRLLLLPPLQLLVAVVPLWWLVSIGQRDVPHELNAERQWGLVSFGLVVGVPLVIMVELVALLFIGFIVLNGLATQPQLISQFMAVLEQLSALDPQTMGQTEVLLEMLQPILFHPAMITLMLLVTVLVVPMIEELLKPAALWVFSHRRLTPATGFAGGLLCGATFALVETLGSLAASSGDSWWIMMLGRFGTGILHITTTALMGWAWGSLREQGGMRRMLQMYAIAVGLHGLWNVFGLLAGLVDYLPPAADSAFLALVQRLSQIAPLALGFLALIILILWIGSSRKLARVSIQTTSDQKIDV